ncbi:hypothetical protein N8J89_16750 [Crossiella sp. CA-258035]|uniref:hypothetical protein n=1 Tax=Crossiella sp. CA-258035 TaxID=2981138 RepID=UPI0024BBF9D8|nr:hypothetical protein [Crossiella sp. CA-258035]WHT22647.1 hypothetical protein N8J89_16750 [Crossiella sp. CA-258035]
MITWLLVSMATVVLAPAAYAGVVAVFWRDRAASASAVIALVIGLHEHGLLP